VLVVSPLTISLSPLLPLLPPRMSRHEEFKATALPIVSQNRRVLDSELDLVPTRRSASRPGRRVQVPGYLNAHREGAGADV
jgi:hypothetical protein